MNRVLKEQSGFTLPEVLVAMVMMLTVMFALYSIFDTSLRVFSFGNDKVEAVENARIGMERMEREIRAAYPYDKAAGDDTLLATHESNEITFGHDTNGNRQIETTGEEITYQLSSSGAPYTLQRVSPSDDIIPDPLAEFVKEDGLEFQYFRFDEDGNKVEVSSGEDEGNVKIVRITLEIDVDDRTQTLTTDVALRNRSG